MRTVDVTIRPTCLYIKSIFVYVKNLGEFSAEVINESNEKNRSFYLKIAIANPFVFVSLRSGQANKMVS